MLPADQLQARTTARRSPRKDELKKFPSTEVKSQGMLGGVLQREAFAYSAYSGFESDLLTGAKSVQVAGCAPGDPQRCTSEAGVA